MRYSSKRTYKWSDSIAYSVGLITSDGCMQKDGRHIDLTSNDVEQLNNFSSAIGRTLAIGEKKNSTGQQSYRVQFSDVSYYDFLLSVGLTPVKSRDLKSLNIPSLYYPAFFRGVFDGDGTAYAYIDKRWNKSYMYYIGICSASRDFLVYLQLKNRLLFKTTRGSLRKSNSAYILMYAKKDSRLIYENMYKSANNLYLHRKREKIESFIIQDENATIIQN